MWPAPTLPVAHVVRAECGRGHPQSGALATRASLVPARDELAPDPTHVHRMPVDREAGMNVAGMRGWPRASPRVAGPCPQACPGLLGRTPGALDRNWNPAGRPGCSWPLPVAPRRLGAWISGVSPGLAATLERVLRDVARIARGQQALFAVVDTLVKTFLTCVPDPPADGMPQSVARARDRYSRFVKTAGRAVVGDPPGALGGEECRV